MAGRINEAEDREPPLSGQARKTGKTLIITKGSKRCSKRRRNISKAYRSNQKLPLIIIRG